MGILFTFITGLFFIIGILINKLCKNSDNISVLAIGLAFVVILNLIIFDIAPEALEHFSYLNIVFIVLGLLILKLMDLFVPHHHHDHHKKNDNVKEHHHHLEHISVITILALSLHNIIECMAVYQVTSASVKEGALMCLAIGLHNLPLGFSIGSNIKKRSWIYIGILTLSGLIGGLIALLIGSFSEMATIYILCFTLGMLIYLAIFELLKELISAGKNIYSLYGIIIGIIVVIVSHLI